MEIQLDPPPNSGLAEHGFSDELFSWELESEQGKLLFFDRKKMARLKPVSGDDWLFDWEWEWWGVSNPSWVI
jgi:hypothetical protein